MMKKLLLLLIALSTYFLGISQVPANDLIENAIDVSSITSFNDDNIRLDLATNTTSGTGANGCNVNGFNRVYYKFTAQLETQVTVFLSDSNLQTVSTQTFLIPYTAPDLNQIDEAQLTVVPGYCTFGNLTRFNTTPGQNYYIMVHRPDSNVESRINISQPEDVSLAERNALIDLYNATDGPNWSNSATNNWNSSLAVGSWQGVIVEDGQVKEVSLIGNRLSGNIPSSIGNLLHIKTLTLPSNSLSGSIPSSIGNLVELELLNLSENDLSGTIPASIGDLIALETVSLRGNELSGIIPESIGGLSNLKNINLIDNNIEGPLPNSIINLSNLELLFISENAFSGEFPDLSVLPNFNNLRIDNNFLSFEDLATNHNNNLTIFSAGDGYVFSPQKNESISESILIPIGNSITLDIIDNATTGRFSNLLSTDVYQWFKDGTAITGATASTFTITNAQLTDSGVYYCEITNNLVPDLVIKVADTNLTVDDVSQADRNALIDFYNASGGNNWTVRSNWNTSAPVNTWHGVTTAMIDGQDRVIEINLPRNNLIGTISNSLTTLEHLNSLNLEVNQLNGPIPENIGNLSNLTFLRLNTNNLTGEIPVSIANLDNLNFLILSVNNLTGGIPPELGNLNGLVWLMLGSNPLNGVIPPELGNLTNLQNLDLRANGLTGTIPAELGNLTNLTQLFLFFNQLNGTIPEEIGNLINLNNVSFNGNNLEGPIPDGFSNFSNLQFLNLANNRLNNILPDLSNLPLQLLWIDNNNFRFGDFENQFTSYQNNINDFRYTPQKQLDVIPNIITLNGDTVSVAANVSGTQNNYEWHKRNSDESTEIISTEETLEFIFEPSFGGVYFLRVTSALVPNLILTTPNFVIDQDPTLTIDYDALVALYNATDGDNWTNNTNWFNSNTSLSTWHGLTVENGRVTGINLFNNNLNGTIPAEIGNLTELTFLILAGNASLSGSIPEELTNLLKLETLGLYDCALSGELPTNIGNLSALTYLGLFNNRLRGELPASVANLSNLQNVEIFNNSFSGTLPNLQSGFENLSVFMISDNQFEGTLPDFTVLPNMQTLWIQNNKFQFGDFENQHATYANDTNLNYQFSPQKNAGAPESIALAIGQSGTTNSSISGSQNNYTWAKVNDDGTTTSLDFDDVFNITVNSAADYGRYRLIATNAIVTGLTITTNDFIVGDIPTNNPDYAALVALYNSTNGNNWNFNDNWLDNTKPLNSWIGVSLNSTTNRVERLSLNSINITGVLPQEIGDLSELVIFSMQGHKLNGEIPESFWNLINLGGIFLNNTNGDSNLSFTNTSSPTFSNMPNLANIFISEMSIPTQAVNEIGTLNNINTLLLLDCDLGPDLPEEWAGINALQLSSNNFEGTIPQAYQSSAIQFLDISNNFYDFSDLEPLTNNNSINTFLYSPQRTRDIEESIDSQIGSDITLTVNDTDINRQDGRSATTNTFQWFKDDAAIDMATNDSYVITNAQATDSGVYFCEITNALLPDLTIQRARITLNIGNILSVNDTNLETLSIYPNPVQNWLNISTSKPDKGEITIYDMTGQLVLKQISASQLTSINVENLQTGTYILDIDINGIKTQKRFIKN